MKRSISYILVFVFCILINVYCLSKTERPPEPNWGSSSDINELLAIEAPYRAELKKVNFYKTMFVIVNGLILAYGLTRIKERIE